MATNQAWIVVTVTKHKWPMLTYGPFKSCECATTFARNEFDGHNVCYYVVPNIPVPRVIGVNT